jgi:hypothetical protein
MARDITTDFETELTSKVLRPALFVKAEFPSGDLNLWTGRGERTIGADTYYGSGNVMAIEEVKETQKLQANGLAFTLSGIDSALISAALTEEYQWQPITMNFAVLDEDLQIIDTYQMFSGKMDVIEIEDTGETSNFRLNAESDLIDLTNSRERRYTNEDQQNEFAGDLGLEFMPTNADTVITWGNPA